MPKILGSTRPLHYPLDRNADIQSDTPNDTVNFVDLSEWGTTDPDERQDIVLQLSLNEYLALADTIDVGRDIAYGDNSIEIWFTWVRGLISLSLCDSVAECIENNPAVLQALQNALQGVPENIPLTANVSATMFSEITCDNDSTWGYCKALWQYINKVTIDFLQLINEATNRAENLETLISAIPFVNLLPADELAGWIDDLSEFNYEAYLASITVGLEDEIVCDLFCIALNNTPCGLTLGDVYDYFVEKMGGINFPTLTATAGEFFLFLVTGDYPTDRLVYIWNAVQLAIVFSANEFLGINNVVTYQKQAQIGDPDNDWETLCDECEWEYVFLDGEPLPSEATITYGIADGDDKIDGVLVGGFYRAWVTFNFTTDVNILHFEFEWTGNPPNPISYGKNANGLLDAVEVITVLNGSVLPTGTTEWTGDETIDTLIMKSNASEYATLNKITLRGVGYNPFA